MESMTDLQAQTSLPTVRYGSKGEYVKYLQRLLNEIGYSIKVDGDFGKRTEAAVKDFQKRHQLHPIDGIVGPKTWNALLSYIN